MQNKIGVIIPTLGERRETLLDCVRTTRQAGAHFVLMVSPIKLSPDISELADRVVLDSGQGLVGAINLGMSLLSPEISYVTWIGDDDLFEKDGLKKLAEQLDNDPNLSLVYGKCTYINSSGAYLGVNQIGQVASTILGYGPDLIPQPSSLFRLEDFKRANGLNPRYKNAFDFDLFLKLRRFGTVRYIPERISFFRWHDGSLSVNQRWRAVREASEVRRSHLNPQVKFFSFLWEPLVILSTFFAGKLISFRSKSKLTIR